jgi:hypothetical protein
MKLRLSAHRSLMSQFTKAFNQKDLSKKVFRLAGHFIAFREKLLGASAYQVRRAEDGWMVVASGSSVPLFVYQTKQQAIKQAKKIAREQRAHVDIFTKTGSLQARHSFV